MPSTSKKQHNLMAAVAKNPTFAKKVGIKQSVGEDFLEADKGKKFGTGGSANITYGGQGQINKQRTRFGSKFGNKLNVPDESLNKYEGMASGGGVGRPDLQKVNKPKTDHGKATLFRKGGMAKMKHDDIVEDKKLIKKAFGMHDKQLHESKKTDLSKLKGGGMAKDAKKLFKGKESMKEELAEAKAIKSGKITPMEYAKGEKMEGYKKGGRMTAKGEHSVQKQSKRGAEMVKMAKGGLASGHKSADGCAIRGKTRAMAPSMCGGGMAKRKK